MRIRWSWRWFFDYNNDANLGMGYAMHIGPVSFYWERRKK